MPDAALLGGGELGLFVLLVVLLDLLVGRLRVACHLLLYLLDGEGLADVVAQLLFRDVVLLQGLLVGFLVLSSCPEARACSPTCFLIFSSSWSISLSETVMLCSLA